MPSFHKADVHVSYDLIQVTSTLLIPNSKTDTRHLHLIRVLPTCRTRWRILAILQHNLALPLLIQNTVECRLDALEIARRKVLA